MKERVAHLLTICTIAVTAMTTQMPAAYADDCPQAAVLDSSQIEITPALDCLEVSLLDGCGSLGLDIHNLCEGPVLLEQIAPECQRRQLTSGIPCSEEIPAEVPNKYPSINWVTFYYQAREDQEILVDVTHDQTPYKLHVIYSGHTVDLDDGCTSAPNGQSNPSTPLSILTALGIVAFVGHRRRK